MSTVPTVSVCMPVYNAEHYIRDATQSILRQTYTDFEFIIINDGSTDGSRAVLEELARKDSRIRLISRPNTGYVKALNEALSLARGTYIARMDADDISMPQRFEKQVAYLQQHPDCVLLGSQILMIDPYDSPLYEPKHQIDHQAIEAELLAGSGWAIVHPAAMMVRAAVVELDGYRKDLDVSEDLDLFLRLAVKGRIANLPEVLLHYRQHAQSVNHTKHVEQNRAMRAIITEAYTSRGIPMPENWALPQRDVIPIKKEINMWAWLALKNGNVSAARKHAVSLLRMAPLSFSSWRLMFCAIRGH